MGTDWKKELTIACLVIKAVQAADVTRLWQYSLPEVASTEEQVSSAERALGCKLDGQYRKFLSFANGWKRALQNIDIHGTTELTSTEVQKFYSGLIASIDISNFTDLGINQKEICIIAGSRIDGDIFFMENRTTPGDRKIIWMAGTLIDQFPCFDEFFLALVDYNRRELARLRGNA
jgi:hypothetical protein